MGEGWSVILQLATPIITTLIILQLRSMQTDIRDVRNLTISHLQHHANSRHYSAPSTP